MRCQPVKSTEQGGAARPAGGPRFGDEALGDRMRFGAVGGDGPRGAALRPADGVEARLDPAVLVGEARLAGRQGVASDGAIADAGDDEIGGELEDAAVAPGKARTLDA